MKLKFWRSFSLILTWLLWNCLKIVVDLTCPFARRVNITNWGFLCWNTPTAAERYNFIESFVYVVLVWGCTNLCNQFIELFIFIPFFPFGDIHLRFSRVAHEIGTLKVDLLKVEKILLIYHVFICFILFL